MPTLGFKDNDGVDVGNKYVTKDYVMSWYSNIVPNMKTPQLFLWGSNGLGQLGDGSITSRSSPVVISGGGTNWQQVSLGNAHGAAIKSDGTLWTWGYNLYGQLGDSSTTTRSSPGTVTGNATTWSQISCGSYHTAAVKTDGTLWAWGSNSFGQLGIGSIDSPSPVTPRSSPIQTAGAGTDWRSVSCGAFHTAAIKTDGSLYTWGINTAGVLGRSTVSPYSPTTVTGGGTTWKQVACGYQNTAAIKSDGTLWMCGDNTNGELGNGTSGAASSQSSFVQTSGAGTDWKQVACGDRFTAAIKTTGTLWTWGYGLSGQLGNSSGSGTRSSPDTIYGGGTNWKTVACGSKHSVAIKTDGTLWTWGYGATGQLGAGAALTFVGPTTTYFGGTNWKSVGSGCDSNSTAATSESAGW